MLFLFVLYFYDYPILSFVWKFSIIFQIKVVEVKHTLTCFSEIIQTGWRAVRSLIKKPMYLGCYVMYFKLFLTYTHLFITISNVICFNPIAIPIPNDCVVIFSSFYKNISGSCQSNQDEK